MSHADGRRHRPGSRPAAPAILDGILARWERFDRARRGIRPIRPGSVLGLELRRHGHGDVHLADGTVVRRGDLIGEIHLDNERIRAGLESAGWQRVLHPAREDLDALATWSRGLPPAEQPVAYHGATLLWPLARHVGFEVLPRRRTAWVRLDEWFLRWLMVHWSLRGRARLTEGRSPLRSADVWLSRAALERRASERRASTGD